MKRNLVRRALLFVALFGIILSYGCSMAQPGETAAEGNRRHKRVLRIDRGEFWSDWDTFLLTDKPSKLTYLRLP